GVLNINSPSINGYNLDYIKGTFSYNGSDFEHQLTGANINEEHRLSGSIRFPDSHKIFDFSRPFFNLKLQLQNFRLNSLLSGLPLKEELRLNGDIRLTGDDLSQELSLKLRSPASSLEGSLNLKEWKRYEYEFYSFIKTAELKVLSPEFFDTALKIKAKGTGVFPEINGFLNIHSEEVRLNGVPVGALKFDGVIEKDSLALAGSLFDGLLILRARGDVVAPFNYNVEIEFRDASYKTIFRALIKDAPEDVDLGLKGNLILVKEAHVLSGNLYFDKFAISGFGHELRNRVPVKLELRDKRLVISSLEMINEGGSVKASGEINIGEGYALDLRGSTYLWPFKKFSRSIKNIKGKVDFGITVSGKWDSPQLSGEVSLKDGTLSIEDIPYQVTEVNSLIRFNENRINIEQFRGKVAGGIVYAKGIAYLRGFRLGRFNMEVTLNNISATVSEDFTLTFDSNLYLKGERYLRLITGEVRLKKAFYRKFIEWRSWMLKRAEEMPAPPEVSIPTFLDASLNIKITGPIPDASSVLMVDNNIANAKLKVDFLLKGTLKKPVILGRVETLEGMVYFRNNELKLISATADFTTPDRIDPYFRIRAETFSRGYRISLLMEGYLRKFNLSLSSEPHLDEVDIIALLAVGETGTALKGYGGGIGAAEASSFITGQLQETLEHRARLYTGIDRVQISPYVSKTGEIGPRVTVGKKLGERLSILYSSAVGSRESDVIKVEYELSKKIMLVGEKDERGSMGGDIKFRFQFR
ncbi:MAG: translocation/assembly module TamB, partial [Thermodesulfovibrionales bacterium]|nr:translocation/assembly module TamB [Thermodesulfovibrionales bacterium]